MFKNKALLISGGTGSFGNAVLKKYFNRDDFEEMPHIVLLFLIAASLQIRED